MQRRIVRIALALLLLMSSHAFAVGLGEIRLNSALNAPLKAEIELLSASPEELNNLRVTLASAETFERYGLDRPFYLQNVNFEVVRSDRDDGNYVRVTSTVPITEPFLTFLVEATWSRGRLLREYTLLLDPPTFAPPSESQAAVVAPQRSAPNDSGQIERQAQPREVQQTDTRQVTPPPPPRPSPTQPDQVEPDSAPPQQFDTTPGGDYVVERGDTLWGIASRMRTDNRLTMNQTMLAIFEANPQAFAGNINILHAGAGLRVPSADEIFRIDRSDALSEVQRQHQDWDGGYISGSTPPPVTTDTRQSLQLVPPDEEPAGIDAGTDTGIPDADAEPLTREQEILDRIAALEAAEVPIQNSLIEIRNNELAALRQELAQIRGEVYEPIVDEPPVDDAILDDPLPDDALPDDPDEILVDDTDTEPDTSVDTTPPQVITTGAREPSLIDKALGLLTNFWMWIGGALVVVAGILFWFMRRGRDDDDPEDWQPLDRDELAAGALSATETMQAPTRHDESIVVEETGIRPLDMPLDDTIEAPAVAAAPESTADATGSFDSLEDTFSSETAINLDQSDPVAEADFHMAYGLYDQAADLINGALEVEPDREDLLAKLCEIYFVWGNRDSFVDAAERLKGAVGGGGESADWDKIVIMGQQIAADHELFAGAGVAGATKAVDLSFDEDEGEGTGALDMDFGEDGDEDGGGDDDIIDLGAVNKEDTDEEVDFSFDSVSTGTGVDDATALDIDVTAQTPTVEAPLDDDTAESPTLEMPDTDPTAEMPAADDATAESPTIEEQFAGFEGTSDLPSIPEAEAATDGGDSTAEINLDDLDLDVDGLAETEVASLDDLDATGRNELLSDTGINPALDDITGKNLAFDADVTGTREAVDADATGLREALDPDDTGMTEALDDLEEALSATNEMRLAADETGQNPMITAVDGDESTDVGFEENLLDATGHTQILSEDFAVDTSTQKTLAEDEVTMLASMDDDEGGESTMMVEGLGGDVTLDAPADDETMLAPVDDDDDGDFDFAKTEALPPDVFTGNSELAATGEMPAVASTDVDLDLDDLTAALKVSEMGDTVDMPRDDATVEHIRPMIDDGDNESASTMSLGPDDISDDLHEARTMTEVGTKLDLARAYVDMGDPAGARSILEEVLDEGDDGQQQQAQQLLDSLPS